jgi:hypothetical protein
VRQSALADKEGSPHNRSAKGTLNAGKFSSARDKANNAYIDGISDNDWLASILQLVRTQAES